MYRIKDIFEEGGALSKRNALYKKRPSQVEAATQIEFAIRNKLHFILEGSTGFGKSLSYLVPAIKNLVEDGYDGQIVVVTSNISLQDQLYDKDIPYVLDIIDDIYPDERVKESIKPTLIKGIGNFICMDKMENDDFLNSMDLFNSSRMKEIQKFYATTKDGDITKAPFVLTSEEKKKVICTTSNDCKAGLCPHKVDCFYNKQKLKAKMSKLIITNYHMLFSCTSVGSPLFSDASVIIFDEVHEADSILREFESRTISSGAVEYIERKISEIKNNAGPLYSDLAVFDVERLKSSSDDYFNQIADKYGDKIQFSPMLVSSQSDLPDPQDFILNLSKVVATLKRMQIKIEQSLENLSEQDLKEFDIDTMIADGSYEEFFNSSKDKESVSSDKLGSASKGLLTIVNSLSKTCSSIIDMIDTVDATLMDENIVMYVERSRNRIILGVKEIDISPKFKKYFLDDLDVSCILASATISVNGNFEYLKRKLGLSRVEDRVLEYIGYSPFNLTKQELWYIPETALPGNNKDFDESVPYQVEEIIRAANGGALCLFTSNKNLRNCKEHLNTSIPNYRVLAQGDNSRHLLLDEFKNDYNASLLATKSFFTGVDVAGQSLRAVVIDKLPFSTPSDPVQQKLSARPGYFTNHVLPEMIVALKQAVGRGVRSIDDKCVICILDERILSANYSTKIRESFPYEKMLTRDLNVLPVFLDV